MEGESHAYNIDLEKERVPNTAFISVLLIIGLLGNSIYLFSIVYADKKSNSIRYFSVVLSIIDLIGIISGSVLGILQNTYVVTFQSDFACKTLWYISSCAALLSSHVVLMISIEKYRRIRRPLSRQFTKKSRFIAVLLLSCLVSLLNVPILLLKGKRLLKLTRKSINVTNVTGLPTTSEIDVKKFLHTNVTTWLSLSDIDTTTLPSTDILDKTRFSTNKAMFVTGFSCCELDSENHHLRILKSVYDISVLVAVISALVLIVYAYTSITYGVVRRRILRMDGYVSIKTTGLHFVNRLNFSAISDKSDECSHNIPIMAISQQGRFMPSPTNLFSCCLPSTILKARDSNLAQILFKNVTTVITLFAMSYIPSVIFTLFQDHNSDTLSLNASAFDFNFYLTVSRSYLLAHALNPYVSIHFDHAIRQYLVKFVSRLLVCRSYGPTDR